jgi:transcriptional regulator with XRE-family HTH domain
VGRPRRTPASAAGDREANAIAATLGGQLRDARRTRKLRLEDLGREIGLSRSRLSEVELGGGATLPLATWVRLGFALDRPLAARFTPAIEADRLVDSGHLEMQEWVLRTARDHGWSADLEVPTRPVDPWHSADVLLRSDGAIVLIECWNTMRDFGAAVRSTNRKVADVRALTVAAGGTVLVCWLVRPTAANRRLVRAYPQAVRTLFAESFAWVRALNGQGDWPRRPGFVWLDPRAGVRPMRIPST